MDDAIEESGMHFFIEDAFHIEKSDIYKGLKMKGIKSVELIRICKNELMLIEAKTTFANPFNPDVSNLEKFNVEIHDICEKFIHSINILSSIKLGMFENDLPEAFNVLDKLELKLILVIKNHELKWCSPLQDTLRKIMPEYFKKIWRPTILVINHSVAVRCKLAF
jgi:hypothetical protein